VTVPRPAWAEIDLDAVRANVARVKSGLAGDAQVMAVVKANAYGHGDTLVAPAALEAGATWLGVILVDEGMRLRAAGIRAPILLLHEPPPERIDEALAHDLTPVVFTEEGLQTIADAAEVASRSVKVHLKIDTGLNRLGCPLDRLDDMVRALAKEPHIEVEGVFSHFAHADQPRHAFIDEQLHRYVDALDRLKRLGVEPALRHLANSAASLTRPDAHFDMVRLGIAMYGMSPGPAVPFDGSPVLSLKARAAMVKRCRAGEAVSYGHRYRLDRDSTIVSIPLGYADGWPRALSGNADVLVNGQRYPAVGTVTMDSFMADVGDEDVSIGDDVVLIGAQGNQRITADELAERTSTINYEVTTRLSARVPRIPRG
jgi:alanine racemase